VQKVVLKILLDDVTLVAEADDEVVDPMIGVDLHDVPDDRHPSDLDHRLWPDVGFFSETGSQSPSKQYRLHSQSLIENAWSGGDARAECL
jgi:hypothetical protein